MEKYEWRKEDKTLYLPKEKPVVIDVPEMKYFTIKGEGNPASDQFQRNIGALYAMSYGFSMLYKSDKLPEGYFRYAVFPLEGEWDLNEEGRKQDFLDKDCLVYELMIRQPEFITDALFNEVKEIVKKKKPEMPIEQVEFKSIPGGKAVQIMHVGSYDDEPRSFAVMAEFCKAQGLERLKLTHREIYIGDMRKAEPSKLKTVLRIAVE